MQTPPQQQHKSVKPRTCSDCGGKTQRAGRCGKCIASRNKAKLFPRTLEQK